MLLVLITGAGIPSEARACHAVLCSGVEVYDAAKNSALYIWLADKITMVANWVEHLASEALVAAHWVQKLIYWEEIKSEFAFLWGQARNAGTAIQAKIEGFIAQQEAKSDYNNMLTASAMAIAAKFAPPAYVNSASSTGGPTRPPSGNALCDMVNSTLVPTYTYLYLSRPVLTSLTSFVQGLYIGPGMDGSGPQATADAMALRCNLQLADPLYQPDPACAAAAPKDDEPFDFRDADTSFSVLDGHEPLEYPQMTTLPGPGGVNVMVPVPRNANQKAWITALYYIAQMSRRPSPPNGANLTTPDGIKRKAAWDSCVGTQSNAIMMLNRRFAHVTRPNCDDTRMKTLCDIQNTMCEAARSETIGVQLPASFGDCKRGLSEYQADMLRVMMCKSTKFPVNQAAAGQGFAENIDSLAGCEILNNEFRKNWRKEQKESSQAIKDLNRLEKECWPGTDGSPQAATGIRATKPLNRAPLLQPINSGGAEKDTLLKAL